MGVLKTACGIRWPLRRALPICMGSLLVSASMTCASTPLALAAPPDRNGGAPPIGSLEPWVQRIDRQPASASQGSAAVVNCDDGGPGSFRQAVLDAVDGATIDLTATGCSVITLSSGAVVVNVDNLTLQGPGVSTLAISGGNASRILQHPSTSGTLTVNDLTLSDGSTYVGSGGKGNASGGCIFSSGSVVLSHVWVDNCAATAFDSGSLVRGGAIYGVEGVKLMESLVSGSTATSLFGAYGGGVYTRGVLDVFRSRVTGNKTIGYYANGGGAQAGNGYQPGAYRSSSTIEYSLFDGNSAEGEAVSAGGGQYLVGSFLVSNTTIANNTAYNGGGADWTSRGSGLAIMRNTTIAFNNARGTSGLRVSGGLFQLSNSTIAFNTGHVVANVASGLQPICEVDMQSTLIAGNTTDSSGVPEPADIGEVVGLPITGANNLVFASLTAVPADTITGVDPLLELLSDNGGPTPTIALSTGSVAIDSGNNAGGFEHDQRGSGFPRVVGASADIGAIEFSGSDAVFTDGFEGSNIVPYRGLTT